MTARYFAKEMKCPIAIVDKRRDKHNEAIAEYLIGDVQDKICILFDDIIDTAGTICEAAKLLKKEGAKEYMFVAESGHGNTGWYPINEFDAYQSKIDWLSIVVPK